MSTHKNLMTVCCAAVLAFGLAACGSSGSDDEMAATTPAATPPMIDGDADAMDGDTKTPAEQLMAAEDALTTAQGLVEMLTSSSTPEQAAEAYAALGAAQAALHAATNLPENRIAELQGQIDTLTTNYNTANTIAMQAAAVKAELAVATTAVDGLTDESDDTAVAAARTAVAAAQAALTAGTDLPQDVEDALSTLVSSLDSRLGGIETARANAAEEKAAAEMAAAGIAKDTKAAGTKVTAIATEAAQGTTDTPPDAGLGGSVADACHYHLQHDHLTRPRRHDGQDRRHRGRAGRRQSQVRAGRGLLKMVAAPCTFATTAWAKRRS